MYFSVFSFWKRFYAASQKVVNFLRFALGHSTKLQLQYWWVYTAHHKCYLLASNCDRFSTYHYESLGSSQSPNPQVVKQGILLYDAFMFETTYCLYFWHRLSHLPNVNFFSSLCMELVYTSRCGICNCVAFEWVLSMASNWRSNHINLSFLYRFGQNWL